MSLTLFAQDKLSRMKARKDKKKAKAKRLGRKPSLRRLKKKLWDLIAPLIRERYGPRCFTCGGIGTQTGHMFPKGNAHAVSAFMPANLRPQCYRCNINLGGNGAEFAARYIYGHDGPERYEMVRKASMTPHKWTAPEVELFIEKAKLGLDHYDAFYMAYFGLE